MSRPRAFPVATRVPAPVYAELEAAAAARLTTISTITRDFLTAAHLSGAFAAHLAAQLTAPAPSTTPNPTGLTAPSAAPAAPIQSAPVRIERTPEEQAVYLDELFDSPEEKAAKAAARAAAKAPHTASTPAPATHVPQPDAEEQAEEATRAAKRAEYERQRANTLTPEQTLARIAEGMAAVRSQPGHGYIEPYVRVDHAPKREPLTETNSSQLPEPGTPAWVAMAERQGLPPEAIAEVVAATQPAATAPEPKVVSGSFDFDAWGD